MATKQMKKNELKFEDFEPVSEQQEGPDRYILTVNLPGFRKEDFRVEIDDKISEYKLYLKRQEYLGSINVLALRVQIKGLKQFGDNKYKRFYMVTYLPSDIDIEKITGKFEGEVLSLTFPKREKGEPTDEEKASEKKEEETKPKEEPEQTSLKKDEEVKPKEAETDKKVEASTQVFIKKVKPVGGSGAVMNYPSLTLLYEKASQKKEEETKPKEEPEQTSLKKDEEVKPEEAETDKKVEDEPTTNGEKKEELAKAKEGTSMPGIKEAASRINDAINKWKQSNSSGENKEKTMKKNEKKNIVTWKEKISQEARGWSEYASLDSMRDTINRNRKEIAIAVAAFSIGFLVSRKLSSRK